MTLTLVKHDLDLDRLHEKVGPIKALVRSHVKASALLSNVGVELSFQLPSDASSSFKDMLLEMDHRKEELGINRSVVGAAAAVLWGLESFREQSTVQVAVPLPSARYIESPLTLSGRYNSPLSFWSANM